MDVKYGSFVWNFDKELENIRKHGVDFATASLVFLDPEREIYDDPVHSYFEERLFCLGKVEGKILTVRFTYREGLIRLIGAGYWRKGRKQYEEEI